MLIYCQFSETFKQSNINTDRFPIDIDANEKIENLKVIITLRYTDIDPDEFDVFYNNQKIDNDKTIINLI